jgi:hypothetical protein
VENPVIDFRGFGALVFRDRGDRRDERAAGGMNGIGRCDVGRKRRFWDESETDLGESGTLNGVMWDEHFVVEEGGNHERGKEGKSCGKKS